MYGTNTHRLHKHVFPLPSCDYGPTPLSQRAFKRRRPALRFRARRRRGRRRGGRQGRGGLGAAPRQRGGRLLSPLKPPVSSFSDASNACLCMCTYRICICIHLLYTHVYIYIYMYLFSLCDWIFCVWCLRSLRSRVQIELEKHGGPLPPFAPAPSLAHNLCLHWSKGWGSRWLGALWFLCSLGFSGGSRVWDVAFGKAGTRPSIQRMGP